MTLSLPLSADAVVASGLLNESKVAKLTEIPRMTIRKMLGKA